jgi:hypothetical protein
VRKTFQDTTGRASSASACAADTSRHSRAQTAAFCEQSDPQRRLHHVCTAAHRRTRPERVRIRRCERGDGHVDTEHGSHTGGRTGLGEADRASHGVSVGQRERRRAALGRPLHERVGEGGAVAGRAVGGDVQMSRSTAQYLPSPATRCLTCVSSGIFGLSCPVCRSARAGHSPGPVSTSTHHCRSGPRPGCAPSAGE